MQSWEIKLLEPYFKLLVKGTKTVIGRPRYGAWNDMDVGDQLVISNNTNKKAFEIVALHYVHSYSYLEEKYKNQLLLDYRNCYSYKVWEERYKIVGVKIKPI